jgi:hypothetical protein
MFRRHFKATRLQMNTFHQFFFFTMYTHFHSQLDITYYYYFLLYTHNLWFIHTFIQKTIFILAFFENAFYFYYKIYF